MGYLPPIGADLPGCVFSDRCALAKDVCHTDKPPLVPIGGGHLSRCFFHDKAQELPRAAWRRRQRCKNRGFLHHPAGQRRLTEG